MTSKQLIKLLEQDGWRVNRVHGSHHVLKKDGKTEVVPMHNKDLPPGILNAILKRAGLK
jgi:predicted RNA binding protein YcfA (HicA-like mRNA interferase family)